MRWSNRSRLSERLAAVSKAARLSSGNGEFGIQSLEFECSSHSTAVVAHSRFRIPHPEFLEPVPLQPPIQGAAAEAQRLGGLTDVAVEPRHRLLDQEALDFLQAHVFDARGRLAIDAQSELAQADGRALGHQHAALAGVIELAEVARPGMIEQ